MSAAFPRGAPLSTHRAIFVISSSLNEGSRLKCWMPTLFSMNHGGITPGLSRSAVRCLMLLAHGRTSSYVIKDIGAIPSARWQFWQLRCRIDAISRVKVTSAL